MKAFGYTVLAIALVVGALVLALGIYLRVSHYLMTYRAVRKMRRAGRCLSRAEFEQRVATATGTVLFEYPTLGWRVLRVWWTADDVLSIARAAAISDVSPDDKHSAPSPFESWCHDTYTDSGHGRAFLVPLYLFGAAYQRFTKSLRSRFPDLRPVTIRSAVVQMFRTSPNATGNV